MSSGRRKVLVGRVVRDRMEKTVVVEVERRSTHPLYGKAMRRRKRVHAHDERNECRKGDTVRIVETRPLSRLKRWRVAEVVSDSRTATRPAGMAEETES